MTEELKDYTQKGLTIGTDLELIFKHPYSGRRIPAYILMGNPTSNRESILDVPFGTDGHAETGEVRVEEDINPLSLVPKIKKALESRIGVDNLLYGAGWYADNFMESVGGHIHFGHPKIRQGRRGLRVKNIAKSLDVLLSLPLLMIEEPQKGLSRKQQGFGRLGDVRAQPYGFEYRTPPSFLGDMELTKAVFCLSYAIAYEVLFERDGNPITIDVGKDEIVDMAVRYQDVSILRPHLPKIFREIEKLKLYPLWEEEINYLKDCSYKLRILTEKEVKKTWGIQGSDYFGGRLVPPSLLVSLSYSNFEDYSDYPKELGVPYIQNFSSSLKGVGMRELFIFLATATQTATRYFGESELLNLGDLASASDIIQLIARKENDLVIRISSKNRWWGAIKTEDYEEYVRGLFKGEPFFNDVRVEFGGKGSTQNRIYVPTAMRKTEVRRESYPLLLASLFPIMGMTVGREGIIKEDMRKFRSEYLNEREAVGKKKKIKSKTSVEVSELGEVSEPAESPEENSTLYQLEVYGTTVNITERIVDLANEFGIDSIDELIQTIRDVVEVRAGELGVSPIVVMTIHSAESLVVDELLRRGRDIL